MKNYNPWKTSTFVLLFVISLFCSVTSNWHWHEINPLMGVKFFGAVAVVLLLVQLPDLIRLAIGKWKGGRL